MGVFLAVVILAAKPTPSAAITIKPSGDNDKVGSIMRSNSIPPDSKIFEEEEETLASIYSGSDPPGAICSVSMTSINR